MQTAVANLLLQEIVPRHGIPMKLSCDDGTHFVNNAIKQMSDYFGFDLRTQFTYHRQSGGAAE